MMFLWCWSMMLLCFSKNSTSTSAVQWKCLILLMERILLYKPVEVGSLSSYLTGFYTSQVVVWDFWTINRMHFFWFLDWEKRNMEDPCWPMMTGPGRVDCSTQKLQKKHPLCTWSGFQNSILFTHFEKIKSMFIVFSHLHCFFCVCLCLWMLVFVHIDISPLTEIPKIPRLSDSEKAREYFVVSALNQNVTQVYPTTMISFPGHYFSKHVVSRDRT